MKIVYTTDLKDIKLKARGKVRDIYDLGNKLLIVVTDRISAFDVIMSSGIAEKGIFLNQISAFWFNKTSNIIENHMITTDIDEYPEILKQYRDQLQGRSMLVEKLKPLPIECIVRGYITGSGWKSYLSSREICGIRLPDGLKEFQKFPQPIFTPSTKAEQGHDENISFEKAAEIIGIDSAEYLRDKSLELYKFAAHYAETRGIILADTKFEFGLTEKGTIKLIDEALTPDSSRFWDADEYNKGNKPTNFDKQVLRDYLLSLDWDKAPPPPDLPNEIIEKTSERYRIAYNRLLK